MKNTQKITKNNIKLFKIDNETTLFFHADTLQIYPIDNKELLHFLETFTNSSKTELSKHFSEKDVKMYKKFILDTINNAPKSVTWQFDNGNLQTSYETIVLPIAAKCNLACPYCFATSDGGYNFSDFNEESIKKIANFVFQKRKDKSATSIIFFGGEPLLNFECIKFTVEHFKQNFSELSVGYSLTTNGTVLTDEMIDFFEKTGFAILVSLDGFDNEFNVRKYKNGKSSVQDVLNNIEKLRKINNVHLELRATLINTNAYICETYDFFEKLQIPFSIAFAYTSENKSHNLSVYNEDNLQIIKQSFEKLTEYYKNKFINNESIFDKKISTYFNTLRYRQKQNLPCGAGHGYMTIMSDGDIFTCPHFMNDKKYCVGNIDNPDIDASKYSSVLISEISECQNCWAKYICNGHCVAQKISMGQSNQMTMPENECNLLKITFEHYLKLFYFAKKYTPEIFKIQK